MGPMRTSLQRPVGDQGRRRAAWRHPHGRGSLRVEQRPGVRNDGWRQRALRLLGGLVAPARQTRPGLWEPEL